MARPATKKRAGSDPGANPGPSPESVIERITKEWAFATSPDGLRLSPRRFWCSTWNSLAALKEVHAAKERGRAQRWAANRADYANTHFRHVSQGEFQDTAFLASDLLGETDRASRNAEYRLSRRMAAEENLKLAKVQRPQGGGSTRIEDGKVIAEGQPNIFARLADEHEAKKARRER